MPKFPDAFVAVDIDGPDGNAFVILGRTKRALTEAGASIDECNKFMAEATSGDYEHLLNVVSDWVMFEKMDY
jgi:hypothetical protein